MSKNFKEGLVIGATYAVTGQVAKSENVTADVSNIGIPIDSRFSANSQEELESIPMDMRYPNLFTVCDGKLYICDNNLLFLPYIINTNGKIYPDLLPSYVDDIVEGNMYSGTYTYTTEGSSELLTNSILLFAPTSSVLPIGSGIDLSGFFGQFSVPIENIRLLIIYGIGNVSVDNSPQLPSAGVIYVDSVSDDEPYKAYRWSGSSFVEIITQTVSAITETQINSLFD